MLIQSPAIAAYRFVTPKPSRAKKVNVPAHAEPKTINLAVLRMAIAPLPIL